MSDTVGQGVTERRQAEERLRDVEERYLALFNAIDQGFCTVEVAFDVHGKATDYRFLEVSPSFERQTGITNGAGRWMREIAPDQDQHWFDIYGRVALTGEPTRFESHSTPLKRWWSVYAFRIQDPALRRVGILFNDITERKTAEELQRRHTEQLQTLIERAPIGVYLVDADFRLRHVNPIARQVFGDAAGCGRLAEGSDFEPVMRVLWDDVYADELVAIFRHTLATGEPYVTAERAERRRDRGLTEHYAWRVHRILLPDGRFGLVCYFRDVSEEVRARAEAEAANRAKDRFLAVLSHELRSPMNAILGWLRLLEKRGNRDPALLARAVETIGRNVGVQSQVVDDLLDVSRILSNKLEVERKRLDLTSVVIGCVESIRPTAETRGVELQLHVTAPVIEVMGDASRLQQIVSNLLSNAVKFTPVGGTITVTVDRREATGIITVEDTGQGIAPDFLPQLFERFTQADTSASRRHGGLGLGLSIVKNLVARHDGSIEASSAGVGHGARFTVILPLAEEQERAAVPPVASTSAAAAALPILDILLVEDDEDARSGLELLLAETGSCVRAVESVRAALREYDDHAPDVVISDIGMPDEDGYALIQAIRERDERQSRRTLALAMTGFASRQDQEMALRAGFDEHVAKPIEPGALLERLRVLAAVRGNRSGRR
jgi:signal transduction histidine kinase/ActR/RegA family two-component response regulator